MGKIAGVVGRNATPCGDGVRLFLDARRPLPELSRNVNPEDEAFISATIEPIPGRMDREHSRALLIEALGHTRTLVPPPTGDDIDSATERMKRTGNPSPCRRWFRRAVVIVVVLTALWPGLLSRDTLLSANATRTVGGGSLGFLPRSRNFDLEAVFDIGRRKFIESHVFSMAGSRDRALLSDDPEILGHDRWRSRFESLPDDPVLYNHDVLDRTSAGKDLPEDYVANGDRIDPGNGWYRFAATLVWWRNHRHQLSKMTASERERVLRQSFETIRTAMAMPKFDSHRDAFLSRQIAALPPARDRSQILLQSEFITASALSVFQSDPLILDDLPDLIEASGRADLPQESLHAVWETAFRKIVLDSKCYYHQSYLHRGRLTLALERLKPLVPEGEARIQLERQLILLRSMASSGSPGLSDDRPWNFGNARFLRSKEMLPDFEEALPAIQSTRAMVQRLALRCGLLVMLAGFTACLIAHLRWKKVVGPLAGRITSLLRPVDHLMILTIALAFPITVFLLLLRGGPWGLIYRDEQWMEAAQSCRLEAVVLAIAIIVLTVETVRWRLGRRGASLGIQTPGFNPGWIFAMIAIASFATSYAKPSTALGEMMAPAVTAMPVFALTWPFLLFWFARGPKPERRMHRCVLTRAMLAPLALGCASFTAMILLAHAEDRYWTRRNEMEKIRPDYTGNVTSGQEETAAAMQRQLVQILDLQ